MNGRGLPAALLTPQGKIIADCIVTKMPASEGGGFLLDCPRALAQTLVGNPTAVSYGAMPITVKTPACPLVVSPPPQGHDGNWQVEGQGSDLKVLCHDADGKPRQALTSGAWTVEALLGVDESAGFAYVAGRRKAMYITAWGRNVSPEWVETALQQEPALV